MSEHDELTEDQKTAPEAEQVAKIDLNTATVDELRQLPGIGPTLAARIVNYREEIRPFEEPVEITAVQGISESMYDNIAARLIVSSAVTIEIEAEPEVALEDEEPQEPEV